MLTAAVRDLHSCYPRLFITDVRTPCPALWEHNPFLTPLSEADPSVEVLECHYPLINRSNATPYHCLHGYIEFLNDRLGLSIRPTAFKGDIHLSDREKSWFSQVRELTGEETPFWLVVAGGKLDYTIKWWEASRYQEVVDHFRGRIQFVQVGQPGHHHPRLSGVIDLRGQTDLRQLVRLIYHAQGVLCPVTSVMHLAAAVAVKPRMPPNRACVVIGGGREPNQWEAYPHHQYLHTNGALSCCAQGGCWRARTLPLGDGTDHDHPDALCVDVVRGLPRCMDMITAQQVIQLIERYFNGGVLKFLSARQARRAARGVRKTRDNAFDECLNLYTARPAAEAFISQIPSAPRHFRGRGIVICGGGLRYFPGVWVTLNMLRHLGCKLPVQIWHLGKHEADAQMKSLTAPLNAQWIDAEEVRKNFPTRCLDGWELKPYALIHSPFKEVLLLDADNVPVVNPEFLFETPQFQNAGALLWPDQDHLDRRHLRWQIFGVPPRHEPVVESGQLVMDKERSWKPLALCAWYNDHADFYYRYSDGDKETFHMAFRKLGHPYAMPNTAPLVIGVGLCQHDFRGRRIFQHRCHDKWNLFRNNRRDAAFLYEEECLAYLNLIRRRWDRSVPYYRLPNSAHRHSVHSRNSSRKHPARPNVTLVTLYDSSFYEVAKVTTARMRRYAQLHRYRFVEYRSLLDHTRHAAWNKVLAVRNTLLNCRTKWVMWLDADAVIMNFEQRAEDLIADGRDLIFGSDFNGLNSAVFLVRNCNWCVRFLDTVYNLGDINYRFDRFGPKWEQNTIKHVLNNFAGFAEHVALHPERRMNSLPGAYEEGDFIMHLGGMSHAQRLKLLATI